MQEVPPLTASAFISPSFYVFHAGGRIPFSNLVRFPDNPLERQKHSAPKNSLVALRCNHFSFLGCSGFLDIAPGLLG